MSESIRGIPDFLAHARPAARRAARPTAREWARHALLFFAPQKGHEQDVFGFEDGVALELTDPVAVDLLAA